MNLYVMFTLLSTKQILQQAFKQNDSFLFF